MLDKVKLALRLSGTALDGEVSDLINAAIADLRLVGINIPAEAGSSSKTLGDPLLDRAVVLYAKAEFGFNDDAERYIAFVRNRDKDKESNVKHDATVLTEIGYIKANTDEIKAEQKEQRKTNTEFVTRLTDVEASAKQAHKRLDHIEKRMDQAE